MEYKTVVVPGILFELLLLVRGMIATLNIVRKKEIGTQEQLNVTPIKKHEFIPGKLTSFVIVGRQQFTMGLLIEVFLFKIPVEGSIVRMHGFGFHHFRHATAGYGCRILLFSTFYFAQWSLFLNRKYGPCGRSI